MADDLYFLAAAVGAIGIIALWIWAMFHSAQNGQWGWFVMVLLFSPIASLIYALVASKRQRARAVQRLEPGLRDPPGDQPPWAR